MRNLVVVLVFILAVACNSKAQSQNVKVLEVEQFSSKINQDAQLLDVRTSEEYVAGHIENAINVDVLKTDLFKNEIQKLDKTKPILVYCKSGGRSQKASQILAEEGFEVIFDLSGGYKAWENSHK